MARWGDNFGGGGGGRELLGEEEEEIIIDDEDCFILKLDASQATLEAQGGPEYEIIHHTVWGYFSQRSGLLVKLEDSRLLSVKTYKEDGDVFWETSTESVINDYKYVDGVNIAHGGKTFFTVFRYGEESANHKRELQETWKIEEFPSFSALFHAKTTKPVRNPHSIRVCAERGRVSRICIRMGAMERDLSLLA
ncbi:hypothetical protein ACS0TY_030174 [Phlomoides rotata]